MTSFSCGRYGSSQNTAGMPELRARVTASFTQSRMGASFTWHMRQMSPCSTSWLSSTSPVARSTMLATPSSAISKVLSCEPYSSACCAHQAHVGYGAHGLRVEVAVPLAEVDHLLVDACEGALRHHGLDVLQAAVGAPHLAAVADHRRHGGVDDDVVGRVEVGDALGRIDHGQFGAVLVAGVQVALDLVLLALRQRGDLVVEVDHAVVDVDAQFVEQLAVLLEGLAVEDLHAMAEHDGVPTPSSWSPSRAARTSRRSCARPRSPSRRRPAAPSCS